MIKRSLNRLRALIIHVLITLGVNVKYLLLALRFVKENVPESESNACLKERNT